MRGLITFVSDTSNYVDNYLKLILAFLHYGSIINSRPKNTMMTQIKRHIKGSRHWPGRHMTLIQRRLNVDATSWRCIDVEATFYFIVSGEINVYLVKIKVVSITSEMISYHFTIVTDTIYIFTPRFGRLRFSSLFQMWILPPLQNFEHLLLLCFLTKVSSVGMHFLS